MNNISITDIITHDIRLPEAALWCKVLERMIEDAIYPFRLPSTAQGGARSIQDQYRTFKHDLNNGKPLPSTTRQQKYWMEDAISFFESEELEDVLESSAIHPERATDIFDFVQSVITLRKKLYTLQDKKPSQTNYNYKGRSHDQEGQTLYLF